MKRKPARRDLCYLAGCRAATLSPAQAALAWASMAQRITSLESMDIPKFRHLFAAIRSATIDGRQLPNS